MAQPPVPAVPEADPSAAAVTSPETDSSGASTTDTPPEAVAVSAPTEDPAAAPLAATAPPTAASGAATPPAAAPAPAPAAALPAPAGPSGPGGPPIDGEDAEEDEDGAGGKMSFLDHLDELRTRLMLSFGALAGGFVVCFGFIAPIFDFIMEPLAAVLEDGVRMIYTSAPEYFFLELKMAALAGLILATPVVMSQVWLFIAPGLYAHEKRFAIPFVVFASVFFIGGTLFGHYILFQVAWGFFANFGAENEYVAFTPRLQDAFGLYVRLVLACGVIFQLPTIVFFLARMGVASPRFLIRNFKYAFLLCFVFAAILTPTPDPVTMTVMAGPMLALYILSIGIAWVFQKRTAD
ncbi:MAG: twin-arginine translocase subunit TatC [Acidobacteria bacterium]|nr:twin-arginine translocase subunit TatC [Acidobacteriota bacterium]